MNYYCNPINYSYLYQFNRQPDGRITASREGADPSLVFFRGRYLLFPSMTCGFLYSEDLVNWQYHGTPMLPGYDYAPDVRVVGQWLYFCASSHRQGVHYRTRDPFGDEWEKIEGFAPFWNPNLFEDEDGRLYFYWGSSTTEPIYGIELSRETMEGLCERVPLVWADPKTKGFERTGENHIPERSPQEQAMILAGLEKQPMPESVKKAAIAFITGAPYVEGVWVTKHGGRYYLQYGASGSRFNVYGNGVYVSDFPLGPYTLANNNPFSYKPGGFFPGAGHGSTLVDPRDNVWHIATGRICVNHNFERRIGLYPAGWDEDGELFCNQRFGDWPVAIPGGKRDPWEKPEWMLLSYGKPARASSHSENAGRVTDEDIRTWWQAEKAAPGEWVEVDLEEVRDIRAIQINFADSNLELPLPEGAVLHGALEQQRWIDEVHQPTRWLLEASPEGENYFTVEDKREAVTDLPHDLVVREAGFRARFIRLTVYALPYGQRACVSGLRVFGLGHGPAPRKAERIKTQWQTDLDLQLCWQGDALGYNVLWGYRQDKLYHCCQVFTNSARLGGLVKDQPVFVRVDSFNASGITEGDAFPVPRI